VCYMIWYPDLKQDKTQKFVDDFLNLKIENANHIHIELKNTNLRMQGTGFFIINLLKQDKQNIDNALNELVQLFK
jgi:23S rRNA (adenine2030-N6)-methyltransferase